jgi:hypothetical protein
MAGSDVRNLDKAAHSKEFTTVGRSLARSIWALASDCSW